MNERIKELAKQATHQYSPTYYTQEWIQGFAELIANECAKICDQQGRCGWNDDRKQQARVDAELIREHFGIE